MAEQITVTNIVEVDLRVKTEDPMLKHLLPTTTLPVRFSFVINNVSDAIANALRRVVSCELPVKGMKIGVANIQTNDATILSEMIANRLSYIPLMQSCPMDAKLYLEVSNATTSVVDVKTKDIKISQAGTKSEGSNPLKSLPFNENITLFDLYPGKTMTINDISINVSPGFITGHRVLAVNAVAIEQDVEAYNPYTGKGVRTSVANPKKWKIIFNTNGTLPAKEIVRRACENIVTRMNQVHNLVHSITPSSDEYILTIDNETDTIGYLFTRTINDIYPDNDFASHISDDISHSLTIKIKTKIDINTLFKNVIKRVNDDMEKISSFFK